VSNNAILLHAQLTWGFEAEAERMAKRSRKHAIRSVEQREADKRATTCSCCSSISSKGNTTDEEYFRMIAGEESDDASGEETPWMKQTRERFQSADIDADGQLTLEETRNMLSSTESELSGRIDQLENSLKENNAKLDLILQALQKKKSWK
jgi:hypothetical protein